MRFKVGDRVVSMIKDGDGLIEGELGTVIDVNGFCPIIRWDDFNPTRHAADGLTEAGHGWYIFDTDDIELVNDIEDFGDIPEVDIGSVDVLLGVQ